MGFGPNDGYCDICDGYHVVDENGVCTYEDQHPKGKTAKVAKEIQAKVSTWTPEHAAEYVSESWRNAVDSIIETGRRLIEAKQRVGEGNWMKTIQLLPFGDRAAQSLMAIARNPELSDPQSIADLPAAWGTLAILDRLPEGEVTRAIEAGQITPDLTQQEARDLVASIRQLEAEIDMANAVDEYYGGETPTLPVGVVPAVGDIADAEIVDESMDVAEILREEREAREEHLAEVTETILRKRGPEPVHGKARTRVNKRLANKLEHAVHTATEAMRQIATFDGFDETDWLPTLSQRTGLMTDLAFIEDIARRVKATLKTLRNVPGDDD